MVLGEQKHTIKLCRETGPSYRCCAENSVAYSPTGHIIVAEADPPTLHFYEEETGKYIKYFTKEDLRASAYCIHAVYCMENGIVLLALASKNEALVQEIQAYQVTS